MTRIINTVKGPRRLSESVNDPCKYETKDETIRRFKQMIKTCTASLATMMTTWADNPKNQEVIESHRDKIERTKESLNKLTGE